MSIFDAEKKAFKADQLSYDAREAINKCKGKRTRALIAQIEQLLRESDALLDKHRYTAKGISDQVEASIRTARYRTDTFLTLLANSSSINPSRARTAVQLFDDVRALTWRLLHSA